MKYIFFKDILYFYAYYNFFIVMCFIMVVIISLVFKNNSIVLNKQLNQYYKDI